MGRLVCQGHKGRKGNALRTQILSIECRRNYELIASRLGRRGFQLSCEARSGDLYDHVLDFSPGLTAGIGHGNDHGIAYCPGVHGSLNIRSSGILGGAVTAQFHRNGMLLGVEIGNQHNIRIGHFKRAGKSCVQGDRLNGVLQRPGGPVAQGHVYGGIAFIRCRNSHGHFFSNLHKVRVGKVCYRNSTHGCIYCTVFLHLGGDGLFVYRKGCANADHRSCHQAIQLCQFQIVVAFLVALQLHRFQGVGATGCALLCIPDPSRSLGVILIPLSWGDGKGKHTAAGFSGKMANGAVLGAIDNQGIVYKVFPLNGCAGSGRGGKINVDLTAPLNAEAGQIHLVGLGSTVESCRCGDTVTCSVNIGKLHTVGGVGKRCCGSHLEDEQALGCIAPGFIQGQGLPHRGLDVDRVFRQILFRRGFGNFLSSSLRARCRLLRLLHRRAVGLDDGSVATLCLDGDGATGGNGAGGGNGGIVVIDIHAHSQCPCQLRGSGTALVLGGGSPVGGNRGAVLQGKARIQGDDLGPTSGSGHGNPHHVNTGIAGGDLLGDPFGCFLIISRIIRNCGTLLYSGFPERITLGIVSIILAAAKFGLLNRPIGNIVAGRQGIGDQCIVAGGVHRQYKVLSGFRVKGIAAVGLGQVHGQSTPKLKVICQLVLGRCGDHLIVGAFLCIVGLVLGQGGIFRFGVGGDVAVVRKLYFDFNAACGGLAVFALVLGVVPSVLSALGGIVKQVANTGIASLLRRFPGAGSRRAFLKGRQDGHVPGGHFEAISHRAVFADTLYLGGDLGIGLGQFRQVLDDDGIHRVALIGFYLESHLLCLGVDTLICGNLLVRRNLVGGHRGKLAALIYIVGLAVFKGRFQAQLKGIGRGGGGNRTVFGGLGGNAIVLAADGLLNAQESAKGRGAEEIHGLPFHHIHHHAQ